MVSKVDELEFDGPTLVCLRFFPPSSLPPPDTEAPEATEELPAEEALFPCSLMISIGSLARGTQIPAKIGQ